MRRKSARHQPSWVYAAVGASVLALPASGAADVAATHSASASPIKVRVKRGRIAYGRDLILVGQAPAADRGQAVALEFSPEAGGTWGRVASTTIAGDGSFRLVGSLGHSGWVRASVAAPAAAASATGLGAPAPATTASSPAHVAVAATIRTRARQIHELGPRRVELRGRLLPGIPWRRIALQGERAGRWLTLATAWTGRYGDFELRYRPTGVGQQRLRVHFAGDRSNAAAVSRAGSLTVYQQAIASWYYDGGNTACGFHAYYGVASLSAPCGTRVSFSANGRRVEAVVDDRGPYVGGRAWDLNQNTAAAIGFGGVGAVWSSR